MVSAASLTSASSRTRWASAPVTISRSLAAGSTSTRTDRSGVTKVACSRSANGRVSPSDRPTNTENSIRLSVSASRIALSISCRWAEVKVSPAATRASPGRLGAALDGPRLLRLVDALQAGARATEPLGLPSPGLALAVVAVPHGRQVREQGDQQEECERDADEHQDR